MKPALIGFFSMLIFLSAGLKAEEGCPDSGISSLIEKVAAVTAVDHRQTVPQYARNNHLSLTQAEYEFKATGIINCEGMVATAEIAGKSNVLITARHEFLSETCHPVNASKCFFALNTSPNSKHYKIDARTLKTGRCGWKYWPGDWATVKLVEDVPNVKPYRIPNADVHLIQNQTLVAVVAQSTNFKIGNDYPKTVEICRARDVHPFPTIPLSTDCNNSGWASGSALFYKDPTGQTSIAAINVSDAIHKPERTGYDVMDLANTAVILEGDFLRAVKQNLE